MSLKSEWIAGETLFKKEVTRYFKVITQTVLSPIINSTLYLVVFGVSLGGMLRDGSQYLEFLIPGLMAMASLNNSLQNASSSVIISKFHGDLQDLRTMPMSPLTVSIAYSLAAVSRGLMVGLLVFVVGQIFHYVQTDTWLAVQNPGVLLLIAVLGCFIFGNMGIWIGFISSTFDQINGFSNFIILPLIYLGGVFFSLDILHPFWRSIAQANPLVYIINGIRYGVLGESDVAITISFLTIGVFFVLSIFLALYSVKKGSYQRF